MITSKHIKVGLVLNGIADVVIAVVTWLPAKGMEKKFEIAPLK